MIDTAVYEYALREAFAPIQSYLDDPTVSEVMVNGPSEVFVERAGKLTKTAARFESIDALMAAITIVAQYAGRWVDGDRPILEARLPDGSRVEAVLAPAARCGPCINIRRFSRQTLTVARLIDLGALSVDAAAALSCLVKHKQNVIVAGGTGSGKTSVLNALSAFIPVDERVVVIEDASELQLQREHVVQLEAQQGDARGRGRVTVGDLFRACLRMRPDRIVVGEVRGGEALELIQAMTSGHGGCMSTLHATHPSDTLRRLEMLALMAGRDLPLVALQAQIASAVDVIVQVARLRDGTRCVTHISQVAPTLERGSYATVDLFTRRSRKTAAGGRNDSGLIATGEPLRLGPTVTTEETQ